MKTVFTLLAIISCALSPAAFADHWKSLAGYNDTVTLKEGETAFIMTVSQDTIVQYDKKTRRPVQFRLGVKRDLNYHSISDQTRLVTPTARNPFPLPRERPSCGASALLGP